MRRDYSNWTYENYVSAVNELGVKTQEDLKKNDFGLYSRMLNEGFLDTIVPEKKPEFTFDYFKAEVEKIGAKNRRELVVSNRSLYMKGKMQGYIDDLFGSTRIDYDNISFEEFKNVAESLGAQTKTDLRYLDKKLYDKGKNEGWLGTAFSFKRRVKSSKDWTLEDFIAQVKELGASTRSELQRLDSGLYAKVGLKNKEWMNIAFDNPCYTDYSNWTLEDYKSAVQELQPKNKSDLKRKSIKLYQKCSKLGILNDIFGISTRGDYSNWTEDDFRNEIEKLGATGRHDLEKKDRSLMYYIRKQGLLDVLLPRREIKKRKRRDYSSWSDADYRKAVSDLKLKNRTDLALKDNGLYKRLMKIGLIDSIFSESDSLDSLLESYVSLEGEQ